MEISIHKTTKQIKQNSRKLVHAKIKALKVIILKMMKHSEAHCMRPSCHRHVPPFGNIFGKRE